MVEKEDAELIDAKSVASDSNTPPEVKHDENEIGGKVESQLEFEYLRSMDESLPYKPDQHLIECQIKSLQQHKQVLKHSSHRWEWKQMLPHPSIDMAWIGVGEKIMPSKEEQEKFAAIMKKAKTSQAEEYHLESYDGDPLYSEYAL